MCENIETLACMSFGGRSARCLALVLAVGGLVTVPSQRAAADGVKSPLMDEFLAGIQQSGTLFAELQLEGRCTIQEIVTSPNPLSWPILKKNLGPTSMGDDGVFTNEDAVGDYEFAIQGGMTCARARKDGLDSVFACNERYAFALTKQDNGDRYVLNWLEERGPPEVEERVRELGATTVRYSVLGLWELFGLPLDQAIESNELRPREISNEELDGQRLVRVVLDWIPLTENPPIPNISIVVDPENHWSIREAAWLTGHGPCRLHISEVHRLSSGLPVASLCRVEFGYEGVENPRTPQECPSVTARTAHSEILAEETNHAQFYLSHYGLPEPTFESVSWYRSPWALLVGGLALLGIGVFLIRRRTGPQRAV